MSPTVTDLASVVEDLVSERVTRNTFSRPGPYSGADVTLERTGPLGRWVFRGELTLTYADIGIHPARLGYAAVKRIVEATIQKDVRSGGLRCGAVKSVDIRRSIQQGQKRILDVTVRLRLSPFVVCTRENRRYLHVGGAEFEVSDEAAMDLASTDDAARLRALEEVVGTRWSVNELLAAGRNIPQWNLDALYSAAMFADNTLYDPRTRLYSMLELQQT